jgi:hypothetical protein
LSFYSGVWPFSTCSALEADVFPRAWTIGLDEFGWHGLDVAVRYLALGSDESEEDLV